MFAKQLILNRQQFGVSSAASSTVDASHLTPVELLQSEEYRSGSFLKPTEVILDYLESSDQPSGFHRTRNNAKSVTEWQQAITTRPSAIASTRPSVTSTGLRLQLGSKTPQLTKKSPRAHFKSQGARSQTPTIINLRSKAPHGGTMDATSDVQTATPLNRKDKLKLADIVQAGKNLQATSSIFTKRKNSLQKKWREHQNFCLPGTLVKPEFKSIGTKRRNGYEVAQIPMNETQVREAARRVIKSHQRQKTLTLKQQKTETTQLLSGTNRNPGTQKQPGRTMPTSEKRVKERSIDRLAISMTKDDELGSGLSGVRTWKLNFQNEKVRKVLEASEEKLQQVASRVKQIKRGKVQYIQTEPAADFKDKPSPRFNTNDTHEESSFYTATTVDHMRTTHNRQASSLSPKRDANTSSLFAANTSSLANPKDSLAAKQDSNLFVLQKAQLSGCNSVELPKSKEKPVLAQQHAAMTEQSRMTIQNAPDSTSSVKHQDSFSLTLGSRLEKQKMLEAGRQLMIDENTSQANSAQTYNENSSSEGRTNLAGPLRSNQTRYLQTEESQQSPDSMHKQSTLVGRAQSVQQDGPPLLPVIANFESIFSLKDDEDAGQETPHLFDNEVVINGERSIFTNRDSLLGDQDTVNTEALSSVQQAPTAYLTKRSDFLPFTRRHRSTMKGHAKVPHEFLFLKDEGQQDMLMRQKCSIAAKKHKAQIKSLIAKLSSETTVDVLSQEPEVKQQIEDGMPALPLKTKFELESALYYRFDIHKADRKGQPSDWSWIPKVNDFLEREKTNGFQIQLQFDTHSKSNQTYSALTRGRENAEVLDREAVSRIDGNTQPTQLVEIGPTDKYQMTAFSDPVVVESKLPLQVLYNQKIERIRVLEYEKHSPPFPIHFDISEAFNGVPTQKKIKIESESAPKVFSFDIDLVNCPKIYETQLETFTRTRKFKVEAPLLLTDYTKGAKDNKGVAEFVKALHDRVNRQAMNRTFTKKLYKKQKTELQMHDKFTKQVLGMRRGKQFDFVKIEKPELEDKLKAKGKTVAAPPRVTSTAKGKTSDDKQGSSSAEFNNSELSSVASLRSASGQNADLSPLKQVGGSMRKPQTSQSTRKQQHSALSQKSNQSSDTMDNKTQVGSKQLSFKRQRLLKHMETSLLDSQTGIGSEDQRERDLIVGLTVAKDFESTYESVKAQRAQKAEDNKEVSTYQGLVPVHQRLILLCQDFLESTREFELSELFNFQTKLQSQNFNNNKSKADKLQRLIKELFKKYQIEILQPNLEYICNKFQTAYENYQIEERRGVQTKANSKDLLVQFKHSTYDKRQSSLQPSSLHRQNAIQGQVKLKPKLPSNFTIPEKQLSFKAHLPTKQTSFVLNPNFSDSKRDTLSSIAAISKSNYLQRKRHTLTFDKRRTDTQLMSSESQSLTTLSNESKEEAKIDRAGYWFSMLDWTDDERYRLFGFNKKVNHEVTLKGDPAVEQSQSRPGTISSPGKDSKAYTGSLGRSRNARKATILGVLVEDSQRTFEDNFDQSKLRQAVTQANSMFKKNLQIKEIFKDDNVLYRKIVGDQTKITEQSQTFDGRSRTNFQ